MQPKLKLLVLAILLASTSLFAQRTTVIRDSIVNDPPTRAHAIYGELFGNGLLFSANYDFRFNKSRKGLGMHVGIGAFGVPGVGILSFPVGINHLSGTAPNYFEMGMGYTFATLVGFFENGSAHVLIPSVGYRYQPAHKGFFGRVVFSPLINIRNDGGWVFWGGIGLGHTF